MEEKKIPEGLVQKPENYFARSQRGFSFFLRSIFRIYLSHIFVCLNILAFFLVLMMTPALQRVENVFLDYFFRQRPALTVHGDIALIEMGEKSIHAIGRWPWARHYHAALTKILTEWGARAVVFDVLFSEPGTEFDDQALEVSFKESGRVYLPVVLENSQKQPVWIHSRDRFEKHARGTGHINITPDNDGTVRRIKPYLSNGSQGYPHLAVKVAFDILGKEVPEDVRELNFPLDDKGNLLINWAGKWEKTFDHFSYFEILESFKKVQGGKRPRIKPKDIKNKICLIGLTATGHTDIKATPIESVYPALGVHANVINSILTDQFLKPAPFWLNALCLFMITVVTFFLFTPFQNIKSLIIGILFIAGWICFCFFIFSQYEVVITVLHPILLILSLFIASAVYAQVILKKEQKRLYRLATRDGLTGLLVIRHFREILNRVTAESRLKKQPLSVILMDIDNFKTINDTYGHQVGDQVLQRTAEMIREGVRQKKASMGMNVAARYGGEEFIVMLRHCPLTKACFQVAERIRRAVADTPLTLDGKKISVTVSLGVATLGEDENVPDMMVRRADEALYRAKKDGKNRVCVEKDANSR